MPGGGTKLVTTTNSPPPARLLDISRLISRTGRILTGVDRVELAYLRALQSRPEPLFVLARSRFGYILLGPESLPALLDRITGAVPWGDPDRLSRWSRGRSEDVRRAESDLRRLALGRCLPRRLPGLLRRHLPPGFVYCNTGHSNLTNRTLTGVRQGGAGQIAVFLHDTIPLDHPDHQRPETPARFAGLLARVQRHADIVLCNSDATRADLLRHMDAARALPRIVPAHLGVDMVPPAPADLPQGLPPPRPYFVTVGTIEPRKRHDLLLDVWDRLADPPPLLICGSRGWRNEAVFQRLDSLPAGSPVQEIHGLSDGALAALVAGSAGLLFPSDAEGYGLPCMDAVGRGVPVLCQPLPVFRECLADKPIYADGTDVYLWKKMTERLIQKATSGTGAGGEPVVQPPTWEDHFKIVLRLI